jgi:hypothetical protein
LSRRASTSAEAERVGHDQTVQPAASNELSEVSVAKHVEAYDSVRFPDNFYAGLIVGLDRARGQGVIRSFSGRNIRFEFPFVEVVGALPGRNMPGIELLHEGDKVGFDVGWTSKGLRVTRIKPGHNR